MSVAVDTRALVTGGECLRLVAVIVVVVVRCAARRACSFVRSFARRVPVSVLLRQDHWFGSVVNLRRRRWHSFRFEFRFFRISPSSRGPGPFRPTDVRTTTRRQQHAIYVSARSHSTVTYRDRLGKWYADGQRIITRRRRARDASKVADDYSGQIV